MSSIQTQLRASSTKLIGKSKPDCDLALLLQLAADKLDEQENKIDDLETDLEGAYRQMEDIYG
jgi:hypothetical protein